MLDQVGLPGQEQLQIGFFDGSQVGHVLPQSQVEGGPGVIGRRRQGVPSARQTPDIRKAANESGHPAGTGDAKLLPQVVGEENGLLLWSFRHSGALPSVPAGREKQHRQKDCADGLFHTAAPCR